MKLLLGNGNILVYLDRFSQITDFYFPFVGQENHLGDYAKEIKKGSETRKHRIGVWCDGKLSWMGKNWKSEIKYKKDSLVGNTVVTNDSLGLELRFDDTIHYTKNFYLKKITVKNLKNKKRDIRIFLSHFFNMYGTNIGNTAYYYPQKNAIIYYKNNRYFMVSSSVVFDDYAVGKFGSGMEGSYIDAEDGKLSKNAIEHGSVDSTVSFHMNIGGYSERSFYFWIAAGKSFREVVNLDDYINNNDPETLIKDVEDYWKDWLERLKLDIDQDILDMVKRSLLIIRTQVDNRGGILASTDSDMLKFERDSYNYVWHRDAAFTAMALDEAGYSDLSRKFFVFCENTITDEGFFFQKYNPNYSVGSSWHPWFKYNKSRLPIQEDETALVLHALWKHYEKTNDLGFIKQVYKSLIQKAGNFLASYKDHDIHRESYDLWEEKFGLHTFTACTVFAGLTAAAKFAELMKKFYDYEKYKKAAKEVRKIIKSYLYDKEDGIFFRRIERRFNEIYKETKLDSSTGYGLHEFVFSPDDEIIKKEMTTIEDFLTCKTEIGGVARYENDEYYKSSKCTPGNPWFICTLWIAQYHIKTANKVSDLKKVKDVLKWCIKHSSPTGLLSEQLNPETGEQLSVAPLTWSHAVFVETAIRYVNRMRVLKNIGN